MAFLAIVVIGVGAAYGYANYRFGQIKSGTCSACAAADDSQPFNVLIVGSDSRAGDTGSAATHFGSASQVPGQRSDTIKILHVDPVTGTASILSIPRDTFVTFTGLDPNQGFGQGGKINTAFNDGPNALISTITNSFGIPIQHYVVVDFQGVIDSVNALGGISMNVPFPIRDDDAGHNNSGLDITTTGCQVLTGNEVLELSRSRYFEYEEHGVWHSDPTSDLGRIQRQNLIIEAIIDKAKGTYDPIRLNSLLGSLVHDISIDKNMSMGTLYSLAERYHAFSGSALQTATLPTTTGYYHGASMQIVDWSAAAQMIQQLLGASPANITTPPLSSSGEPMSTTTTTTTTGPPTSSGSGSSGGSSGGSASSGGSSGSGGSAPASPIPPFDPTPC